MTVKSNRISARGPNLAAVPPWGPADARSAGLFSDEERARLAVLATIVRLQKGRTIYREGQNADAVFVIITGVVKTYKATAAGGHHIAAFLYPDDVFGLSEAGKYTNSAQALTLVTTYRLPISALKPLLSRDSDIEFHVICKLCHELREAQRHAFVISRRRALSKVAMFLQMIERHENFSVSGTDEIYLPMSRSDIGEYLALSLEAVSRSFSKLAALGLIAMRDKRHVKILDRVQFDKVI
jgi:CRP-like cAMP-binding protein